MSPGVLAFSVAVAAAGGFVRGYSGFGSALIWVSGLSLVLPPALVIPATYLLDIVASGHLLPKVWKEIDWRSLRWLLLGTCAATPAGVYLLANASATPIRVAISLVVFTSAVLMWRGFRLRATPGPAPTVATGCLSGVLNGAVGIGGPPAILFYFSSPVAAAVSRASLIGFIAVIDIVAIAAAAGQGLVTGDVVVLAGILVLPTLAGNALGHRSFIRTEPETFRRFALIFLAVLSVGLFLRAVLG